MTQTAELVAGRKLDALVAEKVMGWQRRLYAGRFYWFGPYDDRTHPRIDHSGARTGDDVVLAFAEDSDCERFAPSTDIAAAWQVLEHMEHAGWDWFEWLRGIRASEAPLAICRAALAAVDS